MPETTTYRNALALDLMLLEYRLESVLGAGGFGITYLGWDANLEKHVAIKEYFPADLAVRALDGSVVPVATDHELNYKWGLERFIQEARTLAKFSHPHIVRVNRYFEARGTGYMVMDYQKGESFNQMLKRAPQPEESKLRSILMPLLDGLAAVHEAGFLHRDIKPSNIFIREAGGPVLLDFGASRLVIGEVNEHLTAMVTPGYTPLEQYLSEGREGPWSDVYALGGVLYRAIINENPPNAVTRLKGDTVPEQLAAARGRVSDAFLQAVEWALAVEEKQRPQSVPEWRRALTGEAAVSLRAAAATPAMVAPTVPINAATAPQAQPVERTQPLAKSPAPRSKRPHWRWAAVAAAAFLVVAAIGSWNKQRSTVKGAQAPAADAPAKPGAQPSPVEAPKPALPAAETGVARSDDAAPARPPRERTDRPGDEQRAGMEELKRKAATEFRSADRDGNGYLTRDEVRGRFPLIEREFNRVDADRDGRISPQEFFRLRRWQAQQRAQK